VSRSTRFIAALRPATVVAGGALAVHQLSYLAGYGADASQALHDHGHAYLGGLLPVLAVLTALTVLATVEGGLNGGRTRAGRRSPLGRMLTYAGAILAVFATQEVAETLLVANHPGGIGAFLAHGGLVAVPLAFAFGSLAWLAVRGLEAVEDRIAARFEPAVLGQIRSSFRPRWFAVDLSPAALAGGGAPRAPPST
jgi:hypothetical protein